MNVSDKPRPLSPFFMYRWQYTNTLSFMHRMTGLALSLGLPVFVYWLLAAASGEAMYTRVHTFLASALGRVLLVVLSYAFFYHLLNGVRHLSWDAGYGLERRAARVSGWIAFLGAIALTVFFWLLIAWTRGGAQ